jgi:hypothetical protein
MPKQKPFGSIEERIAQRFNDELELIAPRVAADQGPPPGAKRVHDTQAVSLWGQRDPKVDYQALAMRLLQGGLSPEEAQQLVVVEERPELAQAYAQPAPDAETAHTLATLAEYPFRAGLVLDHSDLPAEQIKRADQLHQQWTKQHADRQDGYAATPPPVLQSRGIAAPAGQAPQPPPAAPTPQMVGG